MSAARSAQLFAFGLEQVVEALFGAFVAGREPEIAGALACADRMIE